MNDKTKSTKRKKSKLSKTEKFFIVMGAVSMGWIGFNVSRHWAETDMEEAIGKDMLPEIKKQLNDSLQNDSRLRKRVTAWVEWVENNLLDDDFKLKLELSNRLDKITDVLESMKADWDNAMHNAKEQDRDYLRWGMLKPLIQKGDKDAYMAEGSFGETLRRMMVLLKPSEDIFVGSALEKDMSVDFASPQELKDILLQIQFYVNAVDNSGKAFNPVYLTQINSEINELLSILDKQIKNNSMRDTETKKTNKFLSGRKKIKNQFVQKNGITID